MISTSQNTQALTPLFAPTHRLDDAAASVLLVHLGQKSMAHGAGGGEQR